MNERRVFTQRKEEKVMKENSWNTIQITIDIYERRANTLGGIAKISTSQKRTQRSQHLVLNSEEKDSHLK